MMLARPAAVSLLSAALAFAATAACAAPGEPDVSYGVGGVVFVDSGADGVDRIDGLLADGDGGVFATGAMTVHAASGADLAVLRLTADGELDPAFGDGGIAGIDSGGISDRGRAIIRQADGKLLVAGRLNTGSYTDWGLARFHDHGVLDTGFGESDGAGARRGYVRINVGPDAFTNDTAVDVAVQSDGRIVVAGVGYQFQCADGTSNCGFKYARFALARFTPTGELDTSFGDNGRVISPGQLFQKGELPTAIARRADGSLPPDDSLTVVGYAEHASEAQVRRYLANGALDTSFADAGVLRIADSPLTGRRTGIGRIEAGVLYDDGRLIVTGTGMDRAFAFMRLLADGSVDTSFGNDGLRFVKFNDDVEHDEAHALALHADGRLTAAGFASFTNSGIKSEDFALVRLRGDGSLDPEFGDGQGRARYPLSLRRDQAHAIVLTEKDRVLAAGFALDDDAPANSRAAFMRLLGSDRIFRDGFEN
jgi:uncharacterized delta-60 repeat protein